ncbi:hypothetical protein BJV74DRAFT_883436 [Russula compacta]|nr:hypothetical protein BJV74DRAFT_883436 [Russula compacta]
MSAATGETYELVCLVEGDDTLFDVIASPTTSIHRLKRLIKEECQYGVLRGIDAKDLTIWKARMTMSDSSTNSSTGWSPIPPKNEWKHLTGKNAQKSVQLDEVVKISDLWPEQPPDGHLQVIIQITVATSVLGKRPRDVDPDLRDLPWLKEVHSKIWNREDFKPQLFRRELTYAHYLDLQNRLKLQHSDRDSPDYNASKHNVLSDKLDFLRSIHPADALSPRHPDNNDDRVGDDDDDDHNSGTSNEDDREIKSLFPFTFSFLDLSVLELENKVTSSLPSLLLLRQEYDYISELIDERPRNNGGSVIVSGQPGTGKTAYRYLRIIEQMIKGCSLLFQVNRTTVYHVSENGVEGDYKPNDLLFDEFVQLVVASSPKGAKQGWIKRAGCGARIRTLVTKLWSLKELIDTGIFLHHDDFSFALPPLWQSWIEKEICRGTNQEAAEDGRSRLLRVLSSGGSRLTHTIFQISPSDADIDAKTFPDLVGCKIESVSRWVLNLLLRQYVDQRSLGPLSDSDFTPELELEPGRSRRGFGREVAALLLDIASDVDADVETGSVQGGDGDGSGSGRGSDFGDLEQATRELSLANDDEMARLPLRGVAHRTRAAEWNPHHRAIILARINLPAVICDNHRAEELTQFYFALSPTKASLSGVLFEGQVLNHLDGIEAERKFKICRLTDPDPDSIEMEWTYRGPIRRVTFDNESTAIHEITDAVQSKEPLHLVPSDSRFPAADSILYDPHDPNAVLTCVQITKNKRQPIVASGLQDIQAWFKPHTPLADLRPSKTRPWRFLFVVPSDMFLTYKFQNLKGATPTGVWATKVHQYVLGIEERTIFRKGKRSDSRVQRAPLAEMMVVDNT